MKEKKKKKKKKKKRKKRKKEHIWKLKRVLYSWESVGGVGD